MAVFLFDKIIFGPVTSRRLGASLGINLLPDDRKSCNFDCIYCECGWSSGLGTQDLPKREDVKKALSGRLEEMHSNGEPLDTITFAGNGEPTVHPHFGGIIEDTIAIRNQWFPKTSIAVLSNASRLDNPLVFNALLKVEQNILKLDSAFEATVQALNRPPTGYSVQKVIEGMKRFNGQFILQTLFVQGSHQGTTVNNSTDAEVQSWLAIVQELKPRMVMIYTIARDTPIETLRKVSPERLNEIADQVQALSIPTQVSY